MTSSPTFTLHPGQTALAEFTIQTGTLKVETGEAPAFHDITDQVVAFLEATHVAMGQLVVFSKHTTAPIWVNEHEPLLLKDVRQFLERVVPRDGIVYFHNQLDIRTVNMNEDECPNGHAHIQHGILGGASATIPVFEGQMTLGRYQSIFLVELDRPRPREVVFQITGITGKTAEDTPPRNNGNKPGGIPGPF